MFEDEDSLAQWLNDRGIGTTEFGQGAAKTIRHLLGEICDGECSLGVEAQGKATAVVRSVANTWIKLRHGHKILVEKQTQLEDGRIRLPKEGSCNSLIAVKNKQGEEWRDAALRCLNKELNLSADQVVLCDDGAVLQKTRTEPSRSFPGIVTVYSEVHCEAKILRDRLLPVEQLNIGLTRNGEEDFTTVRDGHHGGQLRQFWAWESAAVWLMRSVEIGEEPKVPGDDDTVVGSASGDAQQNAAVLISEKLRARWQNPEMNMAPHEVGALRAAISRGLMRMWPGAANIEGDLLFGGRSGSLVLDTTVRDHKGGVTQVCVIKVDRRSDLEKEVEQTKTILPHLGENAPSILCGGEAYYEELGLTTTMGLRTGTSQIGLLAIELVGAAWILPEFARLGGKLMCTFEDLFRWEVRMSSDSSTVSSERKVFGEVAVLLSDVFSRSGILTRVARRTAKRSNDNAWFDAITKKLTRRLDEATSVTAKNPNSWSKSDWFEHGGEACHSAKAELEQFIERLSSPPEWLAQSGTLLSLIHGDFHGGNLLVDLKETPWVVDYGEVCEGPCVFDLARLAAGMLFE